MKLGASSTGLLLLGVSASIAGCGLFPSLDDLKGCGANGCGGASASATATGGTQTGVTSTSTGGTSVTSGTASTGTGGGGPCPGIHGPSMVHLVTNAGVSICIDSTEVTVDDYLKFLAAAQQMTSLPVGPECAFKNTPGQACNTDPQLAVGPTYCTNLPCCVTPLVYINDYYTNNPTGVTQRDHPVLGVDNCDAEAYCNWAGKRLCGTTDVNQKQGDPVLAGELSTSEWALACHGPNNFSFGFTADSAVISGACNIAKQSHPNPFDGTDAVASNPTCATTWPGGAIYDLIGNAFEAENNCDTSGDVRAHDKCHRRSASYYFPTNSAACDQSDPNLAERDAKDDNGSIRCCANPN